MKKQSKVNRNYHFVILYKFRIVVAALRVLTCEKNERITKTNRYGYDLVKSKQNSVVYLGQQKPI
ncbi:hypothetical protein P5673_002440 [Acropora cervicornis]|uniref:Uncharacterized protein n=1 Tax=Acropora cervicornis TaxID=6130 RepID=A0AAD9VFQ5_ACRCE|nr:hypothetical protein P5673_002440 [Acropora cervicornis]